MTVLNFPAAPTVNDTYTENGVTYTWNGSYWQANSGTALDDFYVKIVGDNMSGNLTLGTDKITLNAADGKITADGNIKSESSGDSYSEIGTSGFCRARRNDTRQALLGGSDTYAMTVSNTTLGDNTFNLNWDGSSQFAGDMAIGIDGSFTPSTPAISLNADGNVTAFKSVQTSVFDTSIGSGQGCRIGQGVVQAQRRSDTAAPYTDVYRGYFGPTLTKT